MKRKNTAMLILAAVLTVIMMGCNKNTELPNEQVIKLEPNYSEGESDFEYSGEQESASSVPMTESEPPVSGVESETGAPEENDGYDELILVNADNYIPDDYEVELVTVQGKYKLDQKAAQHAIDFVAAAGKAGFDMRLCSGYRTVEKSRELYNRKVNQYISAGYAEADAEREAARWVVPPGTSEHHTGLAMDLVSAEYWAEHSDLEHEYENYDSFKWMVEHCAEYGFILRYPKDKQDITGITYEPWHYRYVGEVAATYIMENGLCLEEYLEQQSE